MIALTELECPKSGEREHRITAAERDEQVLSMWLFGKAPKSAREYERNTTEFLNFFAKDLRRITVEDLQAYVRHLEDKGTSVSSIRAKLAAIKSLLTYAQRIGYCSFNVGAAVRPPKEKNTLAERILPESDVLRLILSEKNPRNHAILLLLYAAGLRISELCSLRWKDVASSEEGAVLTVFGKGGKTRHVLIGKGHMDVLEALRNGAGQEDPVFRSREGGCLDQSSINRILKKAARNAGLASLPSPHWLRHAHASHALDRGCPVHVVQATLGHASLSVTSRYVHARPKDGSSRFLAI